MKAILVLVMLLMVLNAPEVSARDLTGYLPLEPDLFWIYAAAGGYVWTNTVEQEQSILGRPALRIRSILTGPDLNDTYLDYWSQDEDGNLCLHGWHNVTQDWENYYEPPILWIRFPAEQGDSWSYSCAVYSDTEGTQFVHDTTGTRLCIGAEEVTVPVGTFFSYGYITVSDEPVMNAGTDCPVPGTGLIPGSGGNREYEIWYAWGVGEIRRTFGSSYSVLLSWNGPVGIEDATWSDLKASFR